MTKALDRKRSLIIIIAITLFLFSAMLQVSAAAASYDNEKPDIDSPAVSKYGTESGASDKATETASDKSGSNRTLIFILLGVFIVADIIVIFFIFKGKSSSEGNTDGRKEE